MNRSLRQRLLPLVAFLLLALAGCEPTDSPLAPEPFDRYRGETMGTYLELTFSGCRAGVPEAVARALAEVEAQMSHWRGDSEISRFNMTPAKVWMSVSPALAKLVAEAGQISASTGGALDVTVAPLVDLWGFGPAGRGDLPTAEAVAEARQRVGFQKLEVRSEPPALRKQTPGLMVDLSAIAKGHGVDRVAAVLTGFGCRHFLADIGGEVRALGRNPQGRAWRIGIERPDGGVWRRLYLSDQAVATSGDYRNFRQRGPERISHTLDPRSGMPVTHNLASVTVVAETAARADALATAIAVLGPTAGFEFARGKDIAALLILRRADAGSGFEERYTDAMRACLVEAS